MRCLGLELFVLVACAKAPAEPRVPHQARPFTPSSLCKLPFVDEHLKRTDPTTHGWLQGTVVDSHGEPAIGAMVVAGDGRLPGWTIAITDELGAYVMREELPLGDYTLTVYDDNRQGSHPIEIFGGMVTLDHTLAADTGCVPEPSCHGICPAVSQVRSAPAAL